MKRIDLMKQLDTAQKAVEGETKAREKEQQRLAEAKRKEAESEAKRIAEKQKEILLARQEFELQFKIAQLEKGNAKQQAQAEAIKNAIKRNELMEKYGYDIETATRALKAQKELENKGNAQYSQEDVEKAKRVLERGKGGTIGKKTLEQAQAIVEGKALGDNRVSIFKDVQAQSQRMGFANINAPTDNIISTSLPAQSQLTPSSTPQKNNADSKQNESTNKQPQIMELSQKLLDEIKDIKTSINQFFDKQTRSA